MERRNVYELFLSQSEKGNGYASWKLAMMHTAGRECERSLKRAIKFLEISANQGCALGRRDLAQLVLHGQTNVWTREQAYDALLDVLNLGNHRAAAGLLLSSGRPSYEKATLKGLRRLSLLRFEFEARMLVSLCEVSKSGLSPSRGEMSAHLHEICKGEDRTRATLANRALWLADVVDFFTPLHDPVQIIKALMMQPELESKVDAYELAQNIDDRCPDPIKSAAHNALSVAASLGNKQARIISLTQAARTAPHSARREIAKQVYSIVRESPEHFNEYVHHMFRILQAEDPSVVPVHKELLDTLPAEGQMPLRLARATTLMNLGQTEDALKVMIECANVGEMYHFSNIVSLQTELLKARMVDPETALFYAECYQQDDKSKGLAAVTAVYEAMGAQTSEQKLSHHQVLEERAANNDPEACCDLGIILLEGNTVLLANRPRAFSLLKKAAEGSVARAMYQLGLCHVRGIGTHVDADLGHFWIAQAAAKGYSRAQLELEKKNAVEAVESSKGKAEAEEEEEMEQRESKVSDSEPAPKTEPDTTAVASSSFSTEPSVSLREQIVSLIEFRKQNSGEQGQAPSKPESSRTKRSKKLGA